MLPLRENQKFDAIDLFIFTYCSTVTFGIIFLPYVASEEIRSAWLKVIVSVGPFLLFLYMLIKVFKMYNNQDIFESFKQVSFRWVYVVIVSYLFISSLYHNVVGLKSLLIIVQTFLLPHTNEWFIITAMLTVIFLSIIYGIYSITRFLVMLIILEIFLVMLITGFVFMDEFQFIYIPPVFSVDFFTFLKSMLSDMSRYAGIVALLGFLPYVNKSVPLFKSSAFGLLFVMFTYFIISFVALGVFGFEQTMTLLSPITSLIQSVAPRGGLFERIDVVFLSIWILSFYKILLIHMWFSSYLLNKLIPPFKLDGMINPTLIIIIVFVSALIAPSFVQINMQVYNINLLIWSLIVPICLFLFLMFRNKKWKGSQNREKKQGAL
ncbi:GerAB/ArcD/ProY family transporter [Salipaludibacillus sp. HK11]|uniref:GerAB/ArcD/ProY family transporter n=1 Tax=Salipaludibacillus sp. HK11 TaxID=3394320 RepID=UPI0039FC0852